MCLANTAAFVKRRTTMSSGGLPSRKQRATLSSGGPPLKTQIALCSPGVLSPPLNFTVRKRAAEEAWSPYLLYFFWKVFERLSECTSGGSLCGYTCSSVYSMYYSTQNPSSGIDAPYQSQPNCAWISALKEDEILPHLLADRTLIHTYWQLHSW